MCRQMTGSSPTVAGAGYVALDIILASSRGWSLCRRAGGTCGNVLAILAFLGFESVAIARLGTDSAADLLIADLQSLGVDCEHIQRDPSAKTPRVVEYLPDRPGKAHHFGFTCPMCQRRFPRRSEPNYDQANKSIQSVKPSLFFFDRAGPTTVKLAVQARKAGALVMFEPDSLGDNRNFNMALQVSDVVKFSGCRVGKSIEPLLRKVGARPGLVIETLDGRGLRYMTRGGLDELSWKYQEPFVVPDPIDQAGAGDWCSAGLISRILTQETSERWRERTVERTLAFGQALAAASILFEGPRGYLEKASRGAVLRPARSTLRCGQLPEWIPRDSRVPPEPIEPVESTEVCSLCLVPSYDEELSRATSGKN